MKVKSLALLGLLASFSAASAQQITTSYNFGSIGSPLDSGVSFSGSLNEWHQVDLGYTLTNVEYRLILNTVGGSAIGTSAIGAPADTMNFISNLTVRVSATGATIRDNDFNLPELTATSTLTDISVPGNGGSSGLVPFNDVTVDTNWTQVQSGFWSSFQSLTPATTFTVSNAASAGIPGTSNFTTEGGTVESSTYTSPDYYGSIQVRYTYTIPEPSSALLGGLGLLALFRRRRA